jgi:hypothetical protein
MNLIEQFSKHLFWDVDKDELSFDKHIKYIVRRVLGHGQMKDWRLLKQCYSVETIVQTAQQLRCLDPKTLAFIACMGELPRESFRCYTTMPSGPIHWIP